MAKKSETETSMTGLFEEVIKCNRDLLCEMNRLLTLNHTQAGLAAKQRFSEKIRDNYNRILGKLGVKYADAYHINPKNPHYNDCCKRAA
ncbi:MAG: hypothetical protein ACYS1A_16890 [Planctomycetota bacterium]|jgi:hypothetical protein